MCLKWIKAIKNRDGKEKQKNQRKDGTHAFILFNYYQFYQRSTMDALQIYTTVIGTFIYVAGFIGNFLAFLIFIQKELRQVSTGLLFLLLNIANSIHLLTLIFEFIDSLYDFPVFPSAVFRCQFLL